MLFYHLCVVAVHPDNGCIFCIEKLMRSHVIIRIRNTDYSALCVDWFLCTAEEFENLNPVNLMIRWRAIPRFWMRCGQLRDPDRT